MAGSRKGKLQFEVERTRGKNDQFQQIVRETEDFYDRVENNPVNINIGDVKNAVIGVQQIAKEINDIRNNINSNSGELEYANVLNEALSKAEDKFESIGIMFKNVNDNTRKYVTGLSDILRHLGDSNFGVKFLDVGANFKELQNQAEELYDSLKLIGENTYQDGEFTLWKGSFDKHDLIERIDLLRQLKDVQDDMYNFDPELKAKDFISGYSSSGLQDYIDASEKNLELLRKSGIETTKELERQRDAFTNQVDYHSWDRSSYESAKENLDDSELYASYLQDLRNYIKEREDLLDQLSSSRVYNIFTDEELDNMREELQGNLTGAQGQLKELESLKNIGKNVDFTEVLKALKEIRDVIKSIKDGFEPLTTALNTEGNAFSNMAKEGSASLDTLLSKLQELGKTIDDINKKEFSFSNQTILQQTINKSDDSLKSEKQAARNVVKAYEEVIKIYGNAKAGIQHALQKESGLSGKDIMDMFTTFDPKYLLKGIADSKSASKLAGYLDVIDDFRENLVKLAGAINRIKTEEFDETFDMSRLFMTQDGKKDAISPAATNVENVLSSINSSREKMEQEFISLRESLEKVFDFSTIDPDYQHIESITSKIYSYFEELQTKIKSLDFNISTPSVIVESAHDETKKEDLGADKTANDVGVENKEVQKTESAFIDAAKAKGKFADANKDAAKTAKDTTEEAEKEKEAIKEVSQAAKDAAKNLENAKNKIKTPGEAAVLKGLTQADFEDYAAQIASNQGMKLDNVSVTLGENDNMRLATVRMINEELAQSITYTYQLVQLEDDLTEAYMTSATHTGNINKAQKRAIAEQKKADKEKYRNSKWIIQQQAALDRQNTKYKYSSKPIDGSTQLMSNETSLAHDVDQTIDNLAKHIRTRLQEAISSGTLTDEVKAEILNDLRVLQNEIAVNQNMKYSATTMKASTVQTNKKAYEQFLNAFEARAKKANVFGAMEQDLIDLRAELGKVEDASGLDKFVENLKVARNKLTAETSKASQEAAETKRNEQEYNKLIGLQDKLYNAKKQLAQLDANSAEGLEAQRKVDEAQQEYDSYVDLISIADNYYRIKEREIQLEKELQAIQEDQSWKQHYEQQKNAAREAAAAEKELADARKEVNTYYEQEEKRIASEEDVAWKQHNQEKENEAQKQREINLAYEAKWAKEAAEAERELAQARKETDEYFSAIDREQERINKQNQNYGKSRFNTEAKHYEKLMASIRAIKSDSGLSADFQKQKDAYEKAYNNLKKLREQFANDPNAINNEKLVKDFQDAALEAEKLRKGIQGIVNEHNKLEQIDPDSIIGQDSWNTSKFTKAKDAMKAFADEVSKGSFKFDSFSKSGTEMYGTIVNSAGAIEKLTVKLSEASGEMIAFTGGTKSVASTLDKLKSEVSSSISGGVKQFAAMYLGFNDIVRYLRQGYEYVKEIDDAMSELKKVTEETTATYEKFKDTASVIAQEVGSTMSSVISSASDWARLGYSIEEAAELAKNTSILMNVSEFEDVSKATDTMISALQAFKKEGTDVTDLSTQILDAYNEVGNSYAISTADLADSLTRSSAALVAAGNTLGEAIALTTSANTTIQNPEVVGTALKTLSMRLRGTSVNEIVAAGEETDGLISSASKLAAKIQELTSVDGQGGIKILTESGDFKSTYQILLEIAQVWHDIDDMDQAALLEVIAGKRAGSVVAAILNDAKLLENVFESVEESQGSSLDELQTHLKSIEGTIQGLTNAMQTFWSNFLDEQIIKGFIKMLTKIVDVADKIGGLGTLLGIMPIVGAIKNPYYVKNDQGTTVKNQNGIFNLVVQAIKEGFDKNKTEQTTSKVSSSTINRDTVAETNARTNIGAAFKDFFSGFKIESEDIKIDSPEIGPTKIEETSEATEDLIEQWKALGVEFDDTGKEANNFNGIMGNVNSSQQQGEQAAKKTTGALLKQKAGALAANIGMSILQAGVMALVGIALTALVSVLQKAAQRMDNLKEAAVTSAEALKEDRKEINDYKDEIEELRKTLADNTTSQEDAYEARTRLMEIQDELIDKYGKEAKGINLVSGALENEIAKINELDEAAASDYVKDNIEAFEDAKKNIEANVASSFRVDNITDKDFKEALSKQLSESGFTSSEYEQDLGYGIMEKITEFTFAGTKEEIADAYEELRDWIYQYGRDNQIDVSTYLTTINSKIDSLGINGEKYKQDKEIYDAYIENKAISEYTDVYGRILEEQEKYNEAVLKGDLDAQRTHLNELNNLYNEASTAAAANAEADGGDYMKDFFDGAKAEAEKDSFKLDFSEAIKSGAKKTVEIDGENVEVDAKSIAKTIKNEFDSAGLTTSDVINLGNLLDAQKDGKEVDLTGYTQEQINAYKNLEIAAEGYGLEVKDLLELLNQLGYIKVSPVSEEITNVGKSVDMLSSGMEKYQSAMATMKEVTYDNMQISQDYYTALADYIGDNAKLSEAVYTENGEYIVTNTELLEDLIKQKQKEQAADVKLSRAQARLRYYDLYKQMRNLTKGQNKLTSSALDEVDALYEQMGSIEKTIAKYSLLETKLLGVTNAYTDLELAQAADEETDYGSKAETMVNALAEAFNTAELGTEAAQVAIAGLIPDDVIDKTKTLDEQMKQIHTYFTKGELSKLFKIEYDDEGEIESVEMTKEKIEGFVKTLTKTDLGDGLGTVFQGTWDEFTLNPAITSLEQFAEACGLTEEVAFAFLTSLERYDISWLGEDFTTLLDQLMGDDLDYQLTGKIQELADLEYKIAHGTITEDEQKQYGTLISEMEVLEGQALDTVSRYGELSGKLDETKQNMVDLNEELANTKEGTDEYEALQGEIDKAQQEAAGLVNELEKIGGEPTEFTLQVALDEANEQIDEFKKDLNSQIRSGDKNAVKINAVINEIDANGLEDLGLTKDASGRWQGTANIKGFSSLDAESQQEVLKYLELINSTHVIDAMMGDGITTIEEHLDNIVTILEKTYELSVQAQVDDSEVDKFVDWLNKTVFSKAITFTTKLGDAFNDVVLGGGFGTVNGTAHASGTAHAHGNWGAPKTETALVGELGPEMRVRGSRWELIGQNGAEFTDVRKGDIIFNHKQTEDLLSHGYITGRGKAYAQGTSGTAYAYERSSGTIGVSYTNDYYKAQQKAKVLEKRLEEIDIKASKSSIAYEASQLNKKIQAAQAAAQAQIDTWDKAYKASGGVNTTETKGTGSGSDKDDSEQLIDFIEIKLEEIEADISKTTAKLENYIDDTSTIDEKNDAYDKLVEAEKDKASTYFEAAEYYNKKATELLEKVPAEYREKAKNGAIEIKNFVGESQGEIAEAIQEYRDMAAKADDAEVGYLEAIAQQAALRVQQLEDIASDFENLISLIETEGSIIEAQIDLVEAAGERLSPKYYEALIENSQETIEALKDQKEEMQKEFNSAVKSGEIKKGSDEWYEMANSIAAVDEQIIQCQVDIEEFQNAILDLKWENLDKLISRFDALDSELSHIQERLTDNEFDIVDDDGNWTDKGIAAIGTLAQQMEIAQYKVEEYGKAIDELKKDYEDGLYSTDEYNEKLAELTENQWDSIEAYEDAEDAIVDLTKTRIDAIKDGIEEEIDAYKELIDKKKEALDADKDLYDFEKQVTEQKKDISEIERQLAALSGDTSTSAMAKKKQLEAELAELKAELEDTYRDRSIEKQKEAYDNEYESYEKRKNDEIEGYDKYLEDPDTVVEDAIIALKDRLKIDADVVLSEIEAISDKYGIEISNAIVNPWEEGANAITDYKDSFKDLSDSFSEELDKIIAQEEALQKAADKAAASALKTIDSNMDNVTKATKSKSSSGSNNKKDNVKFSLIESKEESSAGMVSDISGNIKYGQKGENVEKLQTALNELGYDCGDVDGVFGKKTLAAVQKFQSESGASNDGIVGTETKKKFKAEGYKSGTTGVNNDQFAWIDEIGEELVLHAGANGKLTYLTKGSSVIPADLTEKLLNLAVDPTQTLENSRPIINAPHITNNEINISMEFGEVVHIDTVTNDTLPDLTKAVEKQMDKYMKNLNNQIRKYAR